MCIMTLTCIMPLAVLENTKGGQVEGVPSPVHGDLPTSSPPLLLPRGAMGGGFSGGPKAPMVSQS